MRKVIKGRLYDTEKATLVAQWEDDRPVSDYAHTEEALYRKRTGEYFIHGMSNAAGRYAKSCGQNMWERGELIIPISYDSARNWMEKHTETEEYEAEFGIPDEGLEHDLHVVISESAWQAISRKAVTDGMTIRAVIEKLAESL